MAEGSKYPQINANTGVSVAVVAILIGGGWWMATAKYEITEATNQLKMDAAYHEKRVSAAETSLAQIRDTANATRLQQAQAETKQEGRLVRIEHMLQDILARIPQAERR